MFLLKQNNIEIYVKIEFMQKNIQISRKSIHLKNTKCVGSELHTTKG